MLLQISEPGESQIKEACKKRVVGIDLGTTNSLVATVVDGTPSVIGGAGGALVPSVVSYGADGSIVVGRPAEAKALDAPKDTIYSVKRLIGRGAGDLGAIRAHLPYEIENGDGVIKLVVAGRSKSVTPIEVSAEILREVAKRAEADPAVGGAIEGVVITVPAYFDDAQRQATRDAGRLACLEVLRLLAEPTAAALAYGLDRGSRGLYAVYDLGGGTFDISILKLVDGVFEVRATGGDSALGGDDLDRAIATAMLGDRANTDQKQMVAAVREARRVKEALTDSDRALYTLTLADGTRIERAISRAELAELAKPLLDRTGRACRRALKDAGFDREELDGVILVGGSTRSPVVRDYVREIFAKEPLSDLDPDQVVALGAAVQAEVLAGGTGEVVLLDVVPLSLGIETMGGVVEKLIARNTTIPCGANQTFTTYADNQTGFDIHVLQGERETVDACRSLAKFTLRGIPPMIAGMARVEITFLVDADGILHVMAKELTSGKEASIDVKPSYGLTDDEVERMLVESFEHAEDDLRRRNLQIERVEADRILAATRQAFEHDDGLLEPEVRAAGEAAMDALERAKAGDDHLAIRDAIAALDLATKPFAQARMNKAIGAAFEGKALSDVEEELS
ncbi:MAG TPA: Fe-S protein assembly chaperone HscA [Kofleriaceae bacterium]|nr:Fe-S protein assembly chaperone HscA [Kofleriaceae bacterium]